LPIGGIIGAILGAELALVLGSGPIAGSFFVPLAPPPAGHESLLSFEILSAPADLASAGSVSTHQFFQDQKSWSALIDPVTNIQSLGYLIYTYYFYHFMVSGLILLIAMIGAIVLTMYKRKNASKKQFIFKQVSRGFENAIDFVDVGTDISPRLRR
jgi:hypothetical protein